MFAVHEEVALMSSSYSEMRLLRTVYKQFFMPLHLFMFRYYICGYYEVQKTSVVASFRYLQYHLCKIYTLCTLLMLSYICVYVYI